MCSLSIFAPPPTSGQITLCEMEGRLVYFNSSGAADFHRYNDQVNQHLAQYLNIVVTGSTDSVRPAVTRQSLRNTFIQKDLNFWKKVVLSWHEIGVEGVLHEVSTQNGPGIWFLARSLASSALTIFKWLQKVNGTLYPHLVMPKTDMIAAFSPALNWLESQVRAFVWHPQTMKCAIALLDDTVKVFGSHSGITPILKHKDQKCVTELTWKPYCASILAIACSNGIILWHIDPTSLVTRPSSACLTLLSSPGHTGVTSISWHPDGSLLASASPTDTSMLIWDVDKELGVPMQRVSGGGVSFVRWSPDGHRLFAATPSHLFRVWETLTWTCEKWTKLVGRVQCACWSPCGRYLLLAMINDPAVYGLNFGTTENVAPFVIGGTKNAIPLVDLNQIVLSDSEDQYRVGGCVHSMLWNHTGERLVISFKDNPTYIAVFRTRLLPSIEISPCGFIRGQSGECPQFMGFHDQFTSGALLTVCWTNGKISHIPMLFSSQADSPTARFSPPTRPTNGNISFITHRTLFSPNRDGSILL